MKKTVISLLTGATLSTSVFAATNTATANFQWGGVIPEAELITPDVCIDNTGMVDHMNGVLEFSNDGSEIALIDASELSFKVMNNACGEDPEVTEAPVDQAYTYELKQTIVSIGGIPEGDHEWLFIEDEAGKRLSTEVAPISKDAGIQTTLTVNAETTVAEATDAEKYASFDGQDVLVLGVLEVTTTTTL
ncbi:TPA: hypothetical protein ACRZZI_000856 [Vibrio harveyi]|uniref:Uncharacterized protein n=2 Tax=Vibrio harveyi TaxID=669 RepID=A0A8B3D8V6_VIBHA|nr:hypothetical protein [Vibrio harveyi]EKM14494.1 hypothetical protein VCHENC01_0971 [Vibrio harveyi]ELI0635243.1 hypothetical protein [Vibrio harveyi]MCQ9073897.1 hypothetical protein [Vibrio harveyi]RIW02390.1 hypothetical protein DS957_025380 [Vibrio harveyi]HDM8053962.1 hypothetical protein [Vibrio harveyi]